MKFWKTSIGGSIPPPKSLRKSVGVLCCPLLTLRHWAPHLLIINMVKHIILKINIRIRNYYLSNNHSINLPFPVSADYSFAFEFPLTLYKTYLASANVVNVIMSTRLEYALSRFSNSKFRNNGIFANVFEMALNAINVLTSKSLKRSCVIQEGKINRS